MDCFVPKSARNDRNAMDCHDLQSKSRNALDFYFQFVFFFNDSKNCSIAFVVFWRFGGRARLGGLRLPEKYPKSAE